MFISKYLPTPLLINTAIGGNKIANIICINLFMAAL
jgi:hypothetical protein